MEFVIGIDLGTTNCCVAIVEGDKPRVLEDDKGYAIQPSYVCYENAEAPIVGHGAKAQAISNPKHTLYGTKRIIGRKYNSPEVSAVRDAVTYDIVAGNGGTALASVSGQQVSPTDVASLILANMRRIAERALQTKVTKAVVTVPAYFNHAQRKATIESGEKAGLEILRLVNEPTAAALAYGYKKGLERNLLVFDLGGGTFDVSLLEVGADVFEVLVTNGDTFLGGNDFDNAIVEHLTKFYQQKEGIDLTSDKVAMQRVKDAAEKAKCELSFTDRTTILLRNMPGGRTLQMDLNRETLERLCAPLVERCLEVVQKTLDEASLTAEEVDDILLVGGQPRMPAIQKAITKMFGKAPSKGVHPDEAVAMGAAIHGHNLGSEASSILLLDVTPLSLGIDVAGDIFSPVIPKNSTVPVSQKRVFTTVRDEQSEVRIVVRQGEERRASDNSYLGDFLLEGIPAAKRMEPKIEVTFRIDSNGLLHVAAKDQKTGERKSLAIHDYAELAQSGGSRDPADFITDDVDEGDGDGESTAKDEGDGAKKEGFFKRFAAGLNFRKKKATKAEEAPAEMPEEDEVFPEAESLEDDETLEAAVEELDDAPIEDIHELETLSEGLVEDFTENEPITRELPVMGGGASANPAEEISTKELPVRGEGPPPVPVDYGEDPTGEMHTVELPRLEDLNPLDSSSEEAEISGIGSPFGDLPTSETAPVPNPFEAPDTRATVGDMAADPFDNEDLEAALGGAWDEGEDIDALLEPDQPAPPPVAGVEVENHNVSEGDLAELEEVLGDLNFDLPQGAEDFDVESLTLTGRSAASNPAPAYEDIKASAQSTSAAFEAAMAEGAGEGGPEPVDLSGIDLDDEDPFAIADLEGALADGLDFGTAESDEDALAGVEDIFAIAEKDEAASGPALDDSFGLAEKGDESPFGFSEETADDPFGILAKDEGDDAFGLAEKSEDDPFGLADKSEDFTFSLSESVDEEDPFGLADRSEGDDDDPFGLQDRSTEDDDPFGLADKVDDGAPAFDEKDPFGLADKADDGAPAFDEKDPFGLADKDGDDTPAFDEKDPFGLADKDGEEAPAFDEQDPFGLSDKSNAAESEFSFPQEDLDALEAAQESDPFGLAARDSALDFSDEVTGGKEERDPFGLADRFSSSDSDFSEADPFGLADKLGGDAPTDGADENDPFGIDSKDGVQDWSMPKTGFDDDADPFGLESAEEPEVTNPFILSEMNGDAIDDEAGHTIRSQSPFSTTDWDEK